MPEITLEIIRKEGRTVVLLDENSRRRLKLTALDLRQQSEALKKESFDAEALQGRLQADALEKEVKIDDELRKQNAAAIQKVIIAYKEASMGDLDAVGEALKSDPPDLTKARRLAYNRLEPKAVSGWDGELPVKFYGILADACFNEVFCNLSEERRDFLMG